jgi:hypothetical protein
LIKLLINRHSYVVQSPALVGQFLQQGLDVCLLGQAPRSGARN